jgi:predicted Ser/Thr protein kinase
MGLTAPTLSTGTIVAGCRIEAEIGRGGMGVVYRAEQVRLGRNVAVKVLSPALAHDAEFRARFERESRLAASLEHPNIVPVHEAGEEGDLLFLVMRYVDGPDLGRLLAESGRLAPAHAVRLIEQLASALEAAHARGLVHRDVKPANVLLGGPPGREHAYLSDFGVTKMIASEGSSLTRTGVFIGTVDYIAPEQLRGEAVDGRADVYALACLLFHCLTGHVPYPRDDDIAKLYAHGNLPPPRPCKEVPGLPEGFDALVERGMTKDPAERFQSAGDLARAAGDALRGHPIAGPAATVVAQTVLAQDAATKSEPVTPPPTAETVVTRGTRRRGRSLTIALVVAALVGLGGAVALAASGTLGGGRDRARTPVASATPTSAPERTPSGEETVDPKPTPTPTTTPRPRRRPASTGTRYASYVPDSNGYLVDLPAGSLWTRQSEEVINDAIFRTVIRRDDGMTVLIDYTPDEAAVFRNPSQCRDTSQPNVPLAQVCTFQGGPLEQCRAGCVDHLLNVTGQGPGYAVLVGGDGSSETRIIASRVARSLVPR